MNFKSLRGFTLIEMLVVIAIISVLSAIVLTGVSGFQANARDTKRIADLKLVQNYLELYSTKFGHYPGSDTGASANTNTWGPQATSGTLSSIMRTTLGISLPNDPLTGATYRYNTISATDNTAYVLGATLERDNNALRNPSNVTNGNMTPGFTLTSCDNSSTARQYCIGS